MVQQIYKNSDKILYVYFTPFPYYIYNKSNEMSNFALNGVGLGLIQCQQMFWFTTFGMFAVTYSRNSTKTYFINICFYFLFYFLYTISLFRTMYLLNLFTIFIENNKI